MMTGVFFRNKIAAVGAVKNETAEETAAKVVDA